MSRNDHFKLFKPTWDFVKIVKSTTELSRL